MKPTRFFLSLMLVAALVFLTCPILAETGTQKVLYETTFSTNPQWTTNNPSGDYWDSLKEMYHFSIEPSTGNYAYAPEFNYERGSFTLEYDVILEQVDEGASFRLGFSGKDMNRNKGPNVVTEFTNAKYGQIMWLHIITPSSKLEDVNSDTSSYQGPSVKYALNTTYHVKVDYNADSEIVTETVTEKATGIQVWSYYLALQDTLKDMKRIYIGSVGDYGQTSKYATGWIDNVRLTVITAAEPTTLSTQSTSTPMPTYSKRPVTTATKTVVYTHIPTTTPKSPVSVITPIAAIGIIGACMVVMAMRNRR
ncbi:MAG TPA: hypothetical protein PKM50_05175 [Methanoregula sp.]|nr:hypothetical protein [Methanoregula sp.]